MFREGKWLPQGGTAGLRRLAPSFWCHTASVGVCRLAVLKRRPLCGRRSRFPCQAPIDWVLRVLLPNTQVSGYSSQSIRA